ncbi:MAG: ATP-binding cassette domain-containing protein [Bacteroidales bacterium]
MSEEILKALMELFAILAKQDQKVDQHHIDFVLNFLQQQLSDEMVNHYFAIFEEKADLKMKDRMSGVEKEQHKLTSVRDSVKILGICKKINKTLIQEQKIIVLVRLFELIDNDKNYSPQRMAILNTVANVFNIHLREFESIRQYITEEYNNPDILFIYEENQEKFQAARYLPVESLDRPIAVLRIPSVDLYLLRYKGNETVTVNGMAIYPGRVYVLAKGSTIRLPKSKPVYYSDIASKYLSESHPLQFVFEVKDIWYRFPNGKVGLRGISFAENQGNLVGIMGASGAGKTTLLNVLCGLEKPMKGEVLINGINLHRHPEEIKGIIGYIPQDDLLIEELTVFDNLYYNARFCFKEKSEEEIKTLVNKTLSSLGLNEIRNLRVGSVLNKSISGGQRKRLNIALELIREPAILFVDEPTSGLSSRDSENVMDLLRELSIKGKLVVVVIHQPSSDIYKMFDKMVILDNGGYLIYYGNPIEAVMYFKKIQNQINSNIGECPLCGNVNPETIFNIIEAQIVDEYGRYTGKRKVEPHKWEEYYIKHKRPKPVTEKRAALPKVLYIPNWLEQFKIYLIRDTLSKIGNTQFIVINLLEAPLLGIILSFISRYNADSLSSRYVFRENDNLPVYIFMGLIVSLFLGLMNSGEEIFRDRKIIKRESFLSLSRSAYLFAKITVLLVVIAFQTAVFIIVANSILEIKGMFLFYWIALFVTGVFAILLGLNLSGAFNSAVTIYISIPLVMIPMMVLSGAMFSFEKINPALNSIGKTPFIADLMPTRWTYEALMVNQFKDNRYTRIFYPYDKLISICDFKQVYYFPELEKCLNAVYKEYKSSGNISKTTNELEILRNEINTLFKIPKISKPAEIINLSQNNFNEQVYLSIKAFLDKTSQYYNVLFARLREQKEEIYNKMITTDKAGFYKLYDNYYNESISDIVTKVFEKRKMIIYRNRIIQNVDPIYLDPNPNNFFDFRAHFMAPVKKFMGYTFDTFWFNITLVLVYSALLYILLYFDIFAKILNSLHLINSSKNHVNDEAA